MADAIVALPMRAPIEYNDDVVKKFMVAAMVWAIVAFSVGVYLALELTWPAFNLGRRVHGGAADAGHHATERDAGDRLQWAGGAGGGGGVRDAVAGGGLTVFLWSLRAGQYEDLKGASSRILFDDD